MINSAPAVPPRRSAGSLKYWHLQVVLMCGLSLVQPHQSCLSGARKCLSETVPGESLSEVELQLLQEIKLCKVNACWWSCDKSKLYWWWRCTRADRAVQASTGCAGAAAGPSTDQKSTCPCGLQRSRHRLQSATNALQVVRGHRRAKNGGQVRYIGRDGIPNSQPA
jgi:hypothetical protein